MPRANRAAQIDALRRRVRALQRSLRESRRSEEAMRQSGARLRALFEHAEDMIISCRIDGTIVDANRAAERSLGWSREEMLGQHVGMIVTPASVELGQERVRRALAGEKIPKLFELEAVRRDGSLIPVEGWARFIRDADGQPIEHLGLFRDISERRRAEAAVRESEERYRSLFDNANDSILTFTLEGRIVTANQAYQRLTGFTLEELQGHTWDELVAPVDRERMADRTRRALAGEKLPSLFDVHTLCKDGSSVPLEGRTRMMRDPEGQPIGFQGIYRDITERKRAEEVLRQRFAEAEEQREVVERLYRVNASLQLSWDPKDRLRAFVEGVQEVLEFDRFYVALVSSDGARFDVAAAAGVEMFESLPCSPDAGPLYQAYATRQPVKILSDDDVQRVWPLGAAFQDRAYFRTRRFIVVPLVAGDRAIGVASADNKTTRRPITSAQIELFTLLCQQLATALEEARLYAELEEAGRHKSEFLANMSHELRTPLNAILGFSEVLAEGMFGPVNAKQAEYLRDILDSGRHLLSLINDILDLSKIEAGRMDLDPTEFDLPEAIETTLMVVRERAGRRGITLEREIDERLGPIRADERKVKQVLLNLLSNALKFTPEGGRVDVRAVVGQRDMVELSVADTGVGIAPEDQDAVFEEFRQVGTANKQTEGTGLGLALSRKFVELHGGRLWLESEVGRGSTFTFTLPLSARD